MKKALVLLLIVGLIASSLMAPTAFAKKKKKKKAPPPEPVRIERVVEVPYSCPCGVNTPAGGQGFWVGPAGNRFGGDSLPTGADDLYVSAEIKDNGGGTVYARLAQDTDGDLQAETDIGNVCGKSTETMAVPAAGGEVGLFINIGTCADGTPSTPTQGTAVLTFSNLP